MLPRWTWTALFVCLLALASAGGGCGSSSNSDFNGSSSGAGGDAGDDGTTGHKDGGPTFGDGGGTGTLTISPQNPTLNVTSAGTTQQFTASENGNPVSAAWTIDVAQIGTIDAKGLFTATGLLGGPTTVTAQVGNQKASTVLTVKLTLTDNPGNVGPGIQGQLTGGGSADPSFKWLYPYDGTVFARGIGAPVLQTAGAFDAAYLHISFKGLDYKGFYGASNPGRITLSQQLWQTITLSATGGDAVAVELTEIAGGKVTGPIKETWTIAQGNLRGTIYYNSYDSQLAGSTGAIMSLRPGGTAKVAVAGCNVCHAVSADGSTLVAANEPSGGTATDGVWDLKNNTTMVYQPPNRTWVFGALTPNGTKFLNYGAAPRTNDPNAPWDPDVRGEDHPDEPSVLHDSKTGALIPSTGNAAVPHMMMPAFSADGKMVAFTHWDLDQGRTIAVMDFDDATNTFSNLRDVATLPAGAYVGWAAITPDDKFVFFASGTHVEYSTISDNPDPNAQAGLPANARNPTSNLYIAHVGTKTNAPADQLNGKTPAGQVYLPFPDDVNLNFEPTILPEAVGGYFWVVFTSRRNYGNLVNGDPYNGAGGPSPRKKLWVAAINIDSQEHPYPSAQDLTHPAFYLEGQELSSGNMRGFWALDPCQQNGTDCQTGDECCSGFCRQSSGADGGVVFSCVPPSGCANEGEKCTTAADCCGAAQGIQCIAGYCATVTAQ